MQNGEIGPPSELFDINMLVIVCSSILLALCLVTCVYILLKRHRSGNLRDNLAGKEPPARIYSAPIHMRNNSKHELYEISPYAQFAVGFRTFGHVDNQDLPSRQHKLRYDTETSFQLCSESEDSDSISKSTMKSMPRKICRTPHHR
ncbi:PREDICTED: uncharacterized protein LOC106109944 [Papilio polytes]|uniref:uncharacterized protein LOC106109944 n=1 Tax=Papilio polytes TaxID=76194 RepID=UPI0006761FD0|nr:PREDICTED: uncharacterized protein LOC106109944 [Papilio polytes]